MYYICNTYKITIKSLAIANNPGLIKIERNNQYCHKASYTHKKNKKSFVMNDFIVFTSKRFPRPLN